MSGQTRFSGSLRVDPLGHSKVETVHYSLHSFFPVSCFQQRTTVNCKNKINFYVLLYFVILHMYVHAHIYVMYVHEFLITNHCLDSSKPFQALVIMSQEEVDLDWPNSNTFFLQNVQHYENACLSQIHQ